jgi:hypothetical protein
MARTSLEDLTRDKVVHNAAFSGASVLVDGLSSAKRYRINYRLEPNDANEFCSILLNGIATGNHQWLQYETGVIARSDNTGYFAITPLATDGVVGTLVIEPRMGGHSLITGEGETDVTLDTCVVAVRISSPIDFTSITFDFSATSRDGWLTVIQEEP